MERCQACQLRYCVVRAQDGWDPALCRAVRGCGLDGALVREQSVAVQYTGSSASGRSERWPARTVACHTAAGRGPQHWQHQSSAISVYGQPDRRAARLPPGIREAASWPLQQPGSVEPSDIKFGAICIGGLRDLCDPQWLWWARDARISEEDAGRAGARVSPWCTSVSVFVPGGRDLSTRAVTVGCEVSGN
jgi:hypothetical protein